MRSAGGSTCSNILQIGFFEGNVEFRRFWRASPARSARPSAPRSRRPTAEGAAEPCVGTQMDAVRRARRAADVDAGAHRSSRRREVVPETPSRAAPCWARSAKAVSSLLEIICGVGSRLPACTRIVMRRACLCEVRWGNGLRCGARAVVGTLLRAYLLAFCEATTESTLAKRVHVVTLFLLTSSPTRRDAVPGHLESDMTGIWARYQNRRDPVSLARDPSARPLALLAGVLRGLRRGRTVLVSHFCASLRAALGEFPRAPARHDSATRRSQPPD